MQNITDVVNNENVFKYDFRATTYALQHILEVRLGCAASTVVIVIVQGLICCLVANVSIPGNIFIVSPMEVEMECLVARFSSYNICAKVSLYMHMF